MTASIESQIPAQPFFTPIEVAEILKIERRTVIGWLKNPDHPLNGVKLNNSLWRVPRKNFIEYLELQYGKR